MGVKIYDRCNMRVVFDEDRELRFDSDMLLRGKVTIRKENEDIAIEITNDRTPLKYYHVGDIFFTGLRKWVVVEQNKDTTGALSLDYLWVGFDHFNNYADVRKRLNGPFLQAVENQVGIGNIIKHTVKMTDANGITGLKYKDAVSILTLQQYNRYKDIIPWDKVKNLALATPNNNNANDVPNLLYVAHDKTIQPASLFCYDDIYPFIVFDNKMQPLNKPRNDSRSHWYENY